MSDAASVWLATAWAGTVLYYSLLTRVAKSNPRLTKQLKPAKQLFFRRSKAVKQDNTVARAERKSVKFTKQANKATQEANAAKARNAGSDAAPTPATQDSTNTTTPANTTTPTK